MTLAIVIVVVVLVVVVVSFYFLICQSFLSVCLLVSADCVSFSVTNSALLLLFCHILPHFSLLKMARRERERKNETAAAATDGVCALEKKKDKQV